MEATLYRRISTFLLMMVVLAQSCYATRLVFLVTPTGIVVGMDSKVLRQIPDRKTGITRTTHVEQRKLTIINNRIVIGEIGISRMATPTHVVYEFQPWISGIRHRTPSDVSVADFALIIKKETQIIADTLNANSKDALQGINPAYQMPLEFLIWGYDHLAPVGYSVRLEFHGMKITGPFLAQVHPVQWTPIESRLGARNPCAVDKIEDPQSDAHRKVYTKFPSEMSAFDSKKDMGLQRATELVAFVLTLEAECDHQGVGPPYRVATIPKFGSAYFDIYDARANKLAPQKAKATSRKGPSPN
jgi:hypothetical protein